RDPRRPSGEQLRGEVSESCDHAWLDQLDLPPEVAFAGFDLVGLRIPIPRWSALEDVHDVHLLSREADAGEQLLEELSGCADEREGGELAGDLTPATLRADDLLVSPNELLEVRLTVHARVLVDRHRRGSLRGSPDGRHL